MGSKEGIVFCAVLFLALVIPLMALMEAVSRQDVMALDSLFRGVRPASRLFGPVLRCRDVFDGNSP